MDAIPSSNPKHSQFGNVSQTFRTQCSGFGGRGFRVRIRKSRLPFWTKIVSRFTVYLMHHPLHKQASFVVLRMGDNPRDWMTPQKNKLICGVYTDMAV